MTALKRKGPGAAATAHRAEFVASGKPTRLDTSAVGPRQSQTRRWGGLARPDSAGAKQVAEPQRRSA